MTRLEFRIEIEPVPALRPRVTSRGTFTPDKYLSFKHEFRMLARKFAPKELMTGPIYMEIDFILIPAKSVKQKKRPHPEKKPDLDNLIKAVKDSMQDFWKDDAQVCEIHARKVYSWVDRRPGIRVMVEGIA